MTTSIQADKITQLQPENRLCRLEDAKEKHERDKRAKNIVIGRGLPIQNKTKEDTWKSDTKDIFSQS